MAQYKSNIKEVIQNWNEKNPNLRKKTLGSIAKELGVSLSILSQIDSNNSAKQFHKHCAVIFESKSKSKQKALFEIYQKADVLIVKRLAKICEILDCEIYDLVYEKK